MSLSQFLLDATLVIISAAVPIVVTFIVKFIQIRIGSENLRKYAFWADVIVKSVETAYTESGKGPLKKAEAVQYLSDKTKGALSPEDINRIIQASVLEVKRAGKSLVVENVSAPTSSWTYTPSVNITPDLPSPEPK